VGPLKAFICAMSKFGMTGMPGTMSGVQSSSADSSESTSVEAAIDQMSVALAVCVEKVDADETASRVVMGDGQEACN